MVGTKKLAGSAPKGAATSKKTMTTTASDHAATTGTATPAKKTASRARAAVGADRSAKKTRIPKGSSANSTHSGSTENPDDPNQDENTLETQANNKVSGKNSKNSQAKEHLINLGKSKGFLTYDDVHDALSSDDVGPEQMDDLLSALGSEDIEIVEDADSFKSQSNMPPESTLLQEDPKAQRSRISESTQALTAAAAKAADDDLYKSNDPVRMYLRKMGSVALLTREGEVEIAKRIEVGENTVLDAILSSPVAVSKIIEIGERLRQHKVRVKDLVRDAEDEEHEFDEEEADRLIIRLIDRVKRLDRKGERSFIGAQNR